MTRSVASSRCTAVDNNTGSTSTYLQTLAGRNPGYVFDFRYRESKNSGALALLAMCEDLTPTEFRKYQEKVGRRYVVGRMKEWTDAFSQFIESHGLHLSMSSVGSTLASDIFKDRSNIWPDFYVLDWSKFSEDWIENFVRTLAKLTLELTPGRDPTNSDTNTDFLRDTLYFYPEQIPSRFRDTYRFADVVA